MQAAIMLMPDENREALQTLLLFLNEVASSSETNQVKFVKTVESYVYTYGNLHGSAFIYNALFTTMCSSCSFYRFCTENELILFILTIFGKNHFPLIIFRQTKNLCIERFMVLKS